MSVSVVGVRHHSPACARLVAATLDRLRPQRVLIEGPADMNDRVRELGLDHRPPVALFSFHFSDERRHASWSPFCAHSPEWVALRWALARDVPVRFIDLPAWAVGADLENRYADPEVGRELLPELERRLGEQGYDAVWDAGFELSDASDLAERLDAYWEVLRASTPALPSDLEREAFMGEHVAWAAGEDGATVVVCGGFHAPVLRQAAAGPRPEALPLPPPAPAGARSETWLVPYTEQRLDSFSGYASGMPSPAWYRWCWEDGEAEAPRRALRTVASRLRARGQPVSVADTLAAWTQAQALARLRGRRTVARVDLLDAVVSTWVKDALDAPVPWSTRQSLPPGTHPVLVELVAALSGDARGQLGEGTPAPPLLEHVREVLDALDLTPRPSARTVELVPGEPASRDAVFALERLLILGVAGFQRQGRPDASPLRVRIRSDHAFDSSVLEAASYGPTLEAAAVARLEEEVGEADGFLPLVRLLATSLRAGLPGLSARARAGLTSATSGEKDLGDLGLGLSALVGLLRHGGDGDRQALLHLVSAAVERALWLLEGMQGEGPLRTDHVRAVGALRDAVLQVGDELEVPGDRVEGVLSRLALGGVAPAALRGAALGALVSLARVPTAEAAQVALGSMEGASPEVLGDYLAGLLTVGREVLTTQDELLAGLDAALTGLDADGFKGALPSLRVAFAALPPRERAAVGERIAERHGRPGRRLTGRLQHPPALVARARRLEAQVDALLRDYAVGQEA